MCAIYKLKLEEEGSGDMLPLEEGSGDMLPLGLSFHSEGFSESNKIYCIYVVNQRRGGVKVSGREVVTHTHTSNTRRGYTALLKLTHDHI